MIEKNAIRENLYSKFYLHLREIGIEEKEMKDIMNDAIDF